MYRTCASATSRQPSAGLQHAWLCKRRNTARLWRVASDAAHQLGLVQPGLKPRVNDTLRNCRKIQRLQPCC